MLIGSLLPWMSSKSQTLQAAQGTQPQQKTAYTQARLSWCSFFSWMYLLMGMYKRKELRVKAKH